MHGATNSKFNKHEFSRTQILTQPFTFRWSAKKISLYESQTNSARKIGNVGPVGIISLPDGRQLFRRGCEPQPRQPWHMPSQVRVVYCRMKTCCSSGTTYVALPEAVLDGNTWLLTFEQVLLNPSRVERPHTKNGITPLFLVSICPEVHKFPQNIETT
jgi:hypothetical protein